MGASRYELKRKVFDILELNHRYDEWGRHCYDQIICWLWYPEHATHHVEAWWLFSGSTPRSFGNEWRIEYTPHGSTKILVVGKTFRETHTQYDPERADKARWDERNRGGVK
jgi:hypothetical protein